MLRIPAHLLFVLVLLTACEAQPVATTIPAAPPLVGATSSAPTPTPASSVAFTADLDQRIAQAPVSAECDFDAFCQQPDPAATRTPVAGLAWTAWSSNLCLLQGLLPTQPSAARLATDREGTYPHPVAVPNQAGRQLYLVGEGVIALLEIQGERFRALPLGEANAFGGVTHTLRRTPDAELLVLESVRGMMGMGRGASGVAITWLLAYDLQRDTWALHVPIGCYNTHLGYTDEAGENAPGGEQTIEQAWQWSTQGNALVLGPYQVEGEADYLQDGQPGTYTSPTAPVLFQEELEHDSTYLLPPGRYAWRKGQYQP